MPQKPLEEDVWWQTQQRSFGGAPPRAIENVERGEHRGRAVGRRSGARDLDRVVSFFPFVLLEIARGCRNAAGGPHHRGQEMGPGTPPH
jgi:hypothetical protein